MKRPADFDLDDDLRFTRRFRGQGEAERKLCIPLPYPLRRKLFTINADLDGERIRLQRGSRAVPFQVQFFSGLPRPAEDD